MSKCYIGLRNTRHKIKERLSCKNSLLEVNLRLYGILQSSKPGVHICTDLVKLAFY